MLGGAFRVFIAFLVPVGYGTPMIFSGKSIALEERLILALDVESATEARTLVKQLGDSVRFYKIGLELFMAGGYFELIDSLKSQKKRIFVDLKFFDVPRTVGAAVKQLAKRGVRFATVHGNDAMLEAAVQEAGDMGILAVTALTSLDRGDMDALGFKCDVEALVLSRARRALEIGCEGVISSGLEVAKLRENIDHKLVVITPGIRPVDNTVSDDQKRTVDVATAFRNGADYIVVGRPILKAPDPSAAAEKIQRQIAEVFTS